ncbi:Hypothetical protein PACV_109 [Pacmanvirus A23]|uniref:Hypothetical protein n=1 Tax=Pacmanvirus A23 TaxID=1932881 RepID=UPI000A095F2E|nr:Hypothetical protein B9W72_gp108 [Pacmanvirus A23]SIP85825.1 Hypothetical protein PACV_109 [Pacmanvirus A23]
MSRNEKLNAALTEKVKQLAARVEQAIDEANEAKLTLRTVQGLFDASQNERNEMNNLLKSCGIEFVPGKTRLTHQELRKMRKVADDGIDRITAKMSAELNTVKRKYDEMEKSLGAVREISARLSTTVSTTSTVQPQQNLSLYTSLVMAHTTVTKRACKSEKLDLNEIDDESIEPTGKSPKLN